MRPDPARRAFSDVFTSQRSEETFFHPYIGHAEGAQQVTQFRDVGPGHLGRERPGAGHRLGHDLHQRDPGPVVVHQRILRAVDPPGGADVHRLAGVLLQVHPLDLDADRPLVAGVRVSHHDVQPPVDAQRLVVLRDLVVLRHVRVEVVLPREPGLNGDRAVQRQPDLDRVLDGHPVGHRERAGQAQADRADQGVRLTAEPGRAAAEHLGHGAELDVRFEADHRVVAAHRVVVGNQVHGRVVAHALLLPGRAARPARGSRPAAGRPGAG